jgi:hypothetical protein
VNGSGLDTMRSWVNHPLVNCLHLSLGTHRDTFGPLRLASHAVLELKKVGWGVEELTKRPKGDAVKLAIAMR